MPPCSQTSPPSGELTCPAALTSSLPGFPVRISALRALEQAWQDSAADFSGRSQGLLASFDPSLSTWKTCQLSLAGGALKWSGPLPRWGMTVGGALYQLARLARPTSAIDGGYWPTPRASDGPRARRTATESTKLRLKNGKANLTEAVAESLRYATPRASDWRSGKASPETMAKNSRPLCEQVGGLLNPHWVEWLMGYPSGWTALEPLAMPSCPCKQEQPFNI